MDTAKSYRNLGRVCSKLDEYEEAEFLYENSIKIQERLLGENNFDIAHDCAKLAWICVYQEKYEKALCNLIKAYKILFKIRDQDIQRFYRYVYESMEYTYYEWNPEGNFKQWLEEKMKEPD